MISVPEGTVIANTYVVEARLGSGAFGTVYRVRHRYLGLLALKVIPIDSTSVEALAAEGARHAHLFHPNITRVFDTNVTEIAGDGFIYIASEYMASGDLDAYFEHTPRLPITEWKKLVEDLLSALAYAHTRPQPVFHRDIKPSNILIDGNESPTFKLGDFGVSVMTTRDSAVTRAHGTTPFQAPECTFGSYVVESDLYGAALVIYRALAGTYPFALTTDDVGLVRAKQHPERPSRFRLSCTPELDSVMLRALSPEPFTRYHSASELCENLLSVAIG